MQHCCAFKNAIRKRPRKSQKTQLFLMLLLIRFLFVLRNSFQHHIFDSFLLFSFNSPDHSHAMLENWRETNTNEKSFL